MNRPFKLITQLGLVSLMALPIASFAADDISYNFIEVQYVSLDPDNGDSEDGINVLGNLTLGASQFYLNAEYGSVDFDGPDYESFTLGLGWHTAITDSTDFLIEGNYERVEISSFDENGFSVAAGIRSSINQHIELGAKIGYTDLSDNLDGFSVSLNALYKINPTWGIDLSYDTDEDIDADVISIGIRASF